MSGEGGCEVCPGYQCGIALSGSDHARLGDSVTRIDLHNSTAISTDRLIAACDEVRDGWSVGRVATFVRYSRGADFSGTCVYSDKRIYVNVGRHLIFPYRLETNLARAQVRGRRWIREALHLNVRDDFELAMFIFLHEFYHLLVKRAGRNTRQKEGMCDRFAARFLVDRFGLTVRDSRGHGVVRDAWDFRDLDGFVARAKTRDKQFTPRKHPVAFHVESATGQGLLFPMC